MAEVLDVAAGDVVVNVVPCIYIKRNVCTLLFSFVQLGFYDTCNANLRKNELLLELFNCINSVKIPNEIITTCL